MKKATAILLAMLMLTALLAGCGREEQPDPDKPVEIPRLTAEEKQSKLDSLEEKLLARPELEAAVMELDSGFVADLYQLTEDEYELFAVRMPEMNVKALEFGMFWAKEGQAEAVAEGLKYRMQSQKDTFESYAPDQYKLVQDYRILTWGDFAMLLICENVDEVAQIVIDELGAGVGMLKG